ncbi:MAG: GNAT family N-acetyltransferase, partial [Cyanobacteria bacterium P01_F01_bin.116]
MEMISHTFNHPEREIVDIAYRVAQDTDIYDIAALMTELGYSITPEVVSQRLKDIRNQGGEVIVADANGDVVGCINTIIDIRLAEGKCGEIVSLVVSNQFRGQGIGKALMHKAEIWLKDRCNSIRIRAN